MSEGGSCLHGFGNISEASAPVYNEMTPHSLLECSLKVSNSHTLRQRKPGVNTSFSLGTGCLILNFNFAKAFFSGVEMLESLGIHFGHHSTRSSFFLPGPCDQDGGGAWNTFCYNLSTPYRSHIHLLNSPCPSRQRQGCTVTCE